MRNILGEREKGEKRGIFSNCLCARLETIRDGMSEKERERTTNEKIRKDKKNKMTFFSYEQTQRKRDG